MKLSVFMTQAYRYRQRDWSRGDLGIHVHWDGDEDGHRYGHRNILPLYTIIYICGNQTWHLIHASELRCIISLFILFLRHGQYSEVKMCKDKKHVYPSVKVCSACVVCSMSPWSVWAACRAPLCFWHLVANLHQRKQQYSGSPAANMEEKKSTGLKPSHIFESTYWILKC